MTESTPAPAPWWARFTAAVHYVIRLEPAYVAGLWRVLVGVATAVGFNVGADVDARVLAIIVAVYAVVEYLSSRATRKIVVPVDKLPESTLKRLEDGPLPGSAASVEPAPGPIYPQ